MLGREAERSQISTCLKLGRSVLLEGPVGVGKTSLATDVIMRLGKPCFRVDGDSRMSESKLTGGFDPHRVVASGYARENFIAGPLIEAMESGGVLFINELNRFPEGVQNVLLPVLDERKLFVPRLGTIEARAGFVVIATQNPKEFVATSHLSEAILDRFDLVVVDYPDEKLELEIVLEHLGKPTGAEIKRAASDAVKLVRASRDDRDVRRGGSVRAAISLAELASVFAKAKGGPDVHSDGYDAAFRKAAHLTLSTRIETDGLVRDVIDRLVSAVLEGKASDRFEKKKR